MGSKVEIKKILSDIMKNNLNNVITGIMKIKDVNNTILTNVVATLCQLVSKQKTTDDIDVTELTNVIMYCCESLTSLSETDGLNYLRALFHLLKFLSKKLRFPNILDICTHILPHEISIPLSKDVEDIYMHLTVLIHNEIIIPNSKTSDVDTLIKSLNYSLQLHSFLFHKNPSAYFSKLLAYTTLIQKNKQKCLQFCRNIIETFKIERTIESDITKDVYTSIMFLIFTLLSMNHTEVVDKAFGILQKYCVNKEHYVYVETFRLFYVLFYNERTPTAVDKKQVFCSLNTNLSEILKYYGVTSLSSLLLNYISRLLRFKFDEFDKINKIRWRNEMTTDLLSSYMKTFQTIGYMLTLSQYSDNCTNYCQLKHDYSHGVIITNMSFTLFNYAVRNELENVERLENIAYTCLKDCVKYTEKLKECNCEKWLSAWKMIGSLTYNVATKFYCQNNYTYSIKYYKVFCRCVVLFEGVVQNNLCLENSLGLSLSLLGHSYLNLKQYRKALTYLAFGIYICPDMRSKLWQTWCSVKSKAVEENISELTISDILLQDIETIQLIHPRYDYKSDEMKKLLMSELESYSKIWSSKLPMSITCKQLLKDCTDLTERTIALHIVWEKIISLQDADFLDNLQDTIDMLNKTENKNCTSNRACLSILYFIDYQYRSYAILRKNLTEMNEAVGGKDIARTDEEFISNDHCDVIQNLYNNKIENTLELHRVLSKSMDIWLKTVGDSNMLKYEPLIEKLNLENYIKLTGYEYKLQNIRSEMLKCWYIYMNFGLTFRKSDIVVSSIGFIVECCGCLDPEILKLIRTAEEQMKKLDSTHDEIIINYYINKSTGYLVSNKLEEGLIHLNQSKQLLPKVNKKQTKLYESRILHLTSLYLRKSCCLDLISHDQNYLLLSQNAFVTIADYYKSNGNRCPYTLSILFDISFSISWMYRWLRMAREVRCYTSESVLLAQQMVLPQRTSEFLSILAYTDLFNYQLDDCNVKLNGINYILSYNNSKIPTGRNENKEKMYEMIDKFDRISISTVDNYIEMMLDVPIDHKMMNIRGSPILNTTSFKMPVFVNHSDCTCFYCVNVDFHRIIFEYMHLEAVYYFKQNNYAKSLEFFRGGLQYFECIFKKLDYFNNLKELKYSVDFYKKQLKDAYSLFLMDYSFYFVKNKNYEQVNNVLNKIFKILGDDVKYNPYFYMELLMMKINLLTTKKSVENTKFLENETVEQAAGVETIKTPENKVSIAKIIVTTGSDEELFPVKKTNKNIRMNIFESDDEEEDNKPVPTVEDKFTFASPVKTPEMDYALPTPRTNIKPTRMFRNEENKEDTTKLLQTRTRLLTSKLKIEKKTGLNDDSGVDTLSLKTKKTTRGTLKERNPKNNSALKENVSDGSRRTATAGTRLTKAHPMKDSKSDDSKKSSRTTSESKESEKAPLDEIKNTTSINDIDADVAKNKTKRVIKKPKENITTRSTRSRRLDK